MTFECGVCYSSYVEEFKDCNECNNFVCVECYDQLTSKKCPYCRTWYESTFEPNLMFLNERDSSIERAHNYLDQYLNEQISLDDFIEMIHPNTI